MNHAFPCGTLALDFLGTLRARRNPVPAEKLATPELLDDWFVESGMLDAAPHADDADLAAAVELRESLYLLVEDRLGGRATLAAASAAAAAELAGQAGPAGPAEVAAVGPAALTAAVEVLNRYAAEPPVTVRLEVAGVGDGVGGGRGAGDAAGSSAAASIRRTGTAAQGLAAVAREAVEILGGPDAALLRECGRPECTQVYLDRSRGHRREWCAMRTCGNRVKVSAYRSRHRTSTPTPTSSHA
ncbi:CGNR zinc finger domain-containing protein [Promicromonospora sukumoe]|uniref:CGNR zinc finger domain-containing protein n=1 Tax=Promicromonospora sukumoe TaxID=88382 RepID=UPI0003714EC9|nr:CGNR zinc finger domain-containing protein [Promicromonospora sukumoe]